MKKVILFRHGEAERCSFSGTDQDRILTDAGKECFRKNALVLKDAALPGSTLFLCSSALRAVLSLRILMENLGFDPESAQQKDLLCNTGAEGIIRILRTLPEEGDAALLVLHNPAVSEAAALLTGCDFSGFRAGEGVMLDFEVSCWQEIGSSAPSGVCFFRRDA